MYLTKPRLPIWAAFAIFLSWTRVLNHQFRIPSVFFLIIEFEWNHLVIRKKIRVYSDSLFATWHLPWELSMDMENLEPQIETKATRWLPQPPCLFIHFFICHNFNFQASFCIFFAIIICQSFSNFDFTQFLKPLLMNFSIFLIQLNLRFSLNNP